MGGLPEQRSQGGARVLLFCWLGWVFDFYDLILFAFVKGKVADDLKLSLESAIAWIDGWTLLASALGGFAFGRLADRVGRRRALTASILCYSAGALFTSQATGFASLLVARMLTGFGAGGEWGVGHAVIAEHFRERQRDRAHAILQAGSPAAMALAAAVGCFVAPQVGWRTCFLWSALPALLAFAARWAMPGSDRPPDAVVPARQLLRRDLRRPTLVLLLVLVLHMTGFWCVYAWLPSVLASKAGASQPEIGWFQIQVNAVQLVADVAFGFLAARFGRLHVFALFCLLSAAGHAVIAVHLPDLMRDFAAFTTAVMLMGIGAGTWSCFGALFGALYPPELRATAASTLYNVARGAQLFSLPLMGWLSFRATGSFAPALWVGAVCAILSAAAVSLLPRKGISMGGPSP
jgi:MFS family permease